MLNVCIILISISITVAESKRSFTKLKLIKIIHHLIIHLIYYHLIIHRLNHIVVYIVMYRGASKKIVQH